MSRLSLGGLLLLVWLLAWGDVSVANVLSGAAVVAVLFAVFPSGRSTWPTRWPRPVALLRLAGYVAYEMVVSSLLLARQLLRRHMRLEGRVVEIEMHTMSEPLLTFITNVTALTPGTMTVAVSAEPPVITLHTLVRQDLPRIVDDLHRLERLSVRALGSAADFASLEGAERP